MSNWLLKVCERGIDWFCNKIWPKIDPQQQVLGIQLDITNACNLVCDHCYHPHHKNQGALTFDQWLLVLDQYEKLLHKLRMVHELLFAEGNHFSHPSLSRCCKIFAKDSKLVI